MKNITNFEFLMKTEIVFGKGEESKTGELVKKYGGTKVMIVTGGSSVKKSGLFDRVAKSLADSGIPYVELTGVQPNPRLSLVMKGLEIVKAEGVDFMLAVGGGSVIDTAKAIALGMEYDNYWDFFTGAAVPERIAPVGAINTIAASFGHNDACRIGRGHSPLSGGSHGLEVHLSATYDTAHGAGLAVVMPAILQYGIDHDETTIPKIAQFANRVFAVEADPCNPKETAQRGVDAFRSWLRTMGMPLTLTELTNKNLSDTEIDALVEHCWYQPDGTLSAFGHYTRADAKAIYESVR